ncbi:uncharacterized protein LOC128958066 [Oppia nitens]|uniref:uncharacterized protein LOC128958066 n=1 Tax=Oppia nitens TaxID=1686743 RepID=UPI0023DC9178|nr:uncharacterized protein LOC128958066 [Oppia nitens]
MLLTNGQWFSQTLPQLWSIDLSYNQITNIEEDFFTGMPSLTKLRLDSNSLKTLNYKCFVNVWHQLHELWVDNNQMKCDPSLQWIPEVMHPTFFDDGVCYSEHPYNGTRFFYELQSGDSDITPTLLSKQ